MGAISNIGGAFNGVSSGLAGFAGQQLGGITGGLADGMVATNGFRADGTRIDSPVTAAQTQTAYDQTQTGLDQQQAFLQALQAQHGIQNQSDVYNQLGGIANGTGPNPAQAALAQATGANVANQAAMMAGQRGAGSNVGLIARQAAMQGGNLQQQSAGQAATLQAQQALGAISAQGNIAGQQVSNQAGAVQGYNQAAQSEQANLLNSVSGANNARVSLVNGQNNVNAGVTNANTASRNAFTQSLIQGAGTAAMMAKGGEVPVKMADGGPVAPGPASFAGRYLNSVNVAPISTSGDPLDLSETTQAGNDKEAQGFGNMGKAMRKPGQPSTGLIAGGPDASDLSGAATMMAAKGGMAKKPVTAPMLAAQGKEVPGKAKVKGDSLKNDTVPAILSPGEIVIPRHITQGANAPAEAARFVAAILAKKGRKS